MRVRGEEGDLSVSLFSIGGTEPSVGLSADCFAGGRAHCDVSRLRRSVILLCVRETGGGVQLSS